ncbi:MAG: hypothetical protein ACRD3G_06505 [Vicinamibacterales bacterium]
MSFRWFVPVLVVLGLCAAGVRAQEQFTLLATVLDPEKGTPVESLTPADVRVSEDGQPAKVTKVEAVVRQVKVQVLIDNGVGIGSNLAELRSGVRNLLSGLPPDVETTVVTTAPQGRILVRPTKNREELLKGVDRLAPDSSTGRFTESLSEAVERANKEKDTYTVIICAATTSGDGQVMATQMQRVIKALGGRPIIVHVLMYSGERSASGGDAQIDLGQRVTKMTGGRYENINNMTRYVTLLPELGADVAKQATGNTRQFRITAQRPDGKKGDFGKLAMSSGPRAVTSVRLE